MKEKIAKTNVARLCHTRRARGGFKNGGKSLR